MTVTTNQQLILPDGTDNANVPLTFTDFVTTAGSGMENRLVQRYLSIADRTARNPAPNEGELSYLADLNRYDSYTGSAWSPLISPVVFNESNVAFAGIVSAVYTTAGGVIVGGVFTVPQSGQLRVDFSSILDNVGATGFTWVSAQLNTGGVVAGGVPIVAATDNIAITNNGTSSIITSNFYIYSGLTPGNVVNAFLMHRTDVSSGSVGSRKIAISAA